jgi:hypothetical protein
MKRMTLRLALSISLGAALLAGTAFAGIPGLKAPAADMGGSGGAAPAMSAGDFEKQLSETTFNVLSARQEFTNAQKLLADALGVKTEAFTKAAESLTAASGASTKPGKIVEAMKNSSELTANARKEIDEALAKSGELSAEAKVKFAEGTGKFAKGIAAEAAQIAMIKKLVDQGKALTQSASLMDKPKVAGLIKPATELATLVPGDVKEGLATLSQITQFATKHQLALPSEVAAASKLGEGP